MSDRHMHSFLRERKVGQLVFHISPNTGTITRGRISAIDTYGISVLWHIDGTPSTYPYDYMNIWNYVTFSCSTEDM
jgi:hypothetical protein